jgi:hypothetical protein
MPRPARPSFSAAGRERSSPLCCSLDDSFRRYGLILSWCDDGVAVGMGRCGSIQGSSYVVLGVSERLNVKDPELRAGLRGPVTPEAEFPLLWRRACDARSLAITMANGDGYAAQTISGCATGVACQH